MTPERRIEALIAEHAPRVLGALVRRHGKFDTCEDAVQEALIAATQQWPRDGIPDDPPAWLITVAARRLVDALRSQDAARRREDVAARDLFAGGHGNPIDMAEEEDDSLKLLFLCCHPALSAPSQLALTLRALGGLTTAQIAHAFLIPETTMAQRISRAKQAIRASGCAFVLPAEAERSSRLRVVLHVLYLMFNEGYFATEGGEVRRSDLTEEATRLTRSVHAQLPADGEVAGLLALILLTDARRDARTRPDGELVPLAEQQRSAWDGTMIAEGLALITATLKRAPIGPYQVQAAIAAVHAEANQAEDTDWAQIAALYGLLSRLSPNPMVALNHAVALAMVHGPSVGLAKLDDLAGDKQLAGHHRLAAVRGHLFELAGDIAAANQSYLLAARRTTSRPERHYLQDRARRLTL